MLLWLVERAMQCRQPCRESVTRYLENGPGHQAESRQVRQPPPVSRKLGAGRGESKLGLGSKGGCREGQEHGAAQALPSPHEGNTV